MGKWISIRVIKYSVQYASSLILCKSRSTLWQITFLNCRHENVHALLNKLWINYNFTRCYRPQLIRIISVRQMTISVKWTSSLMQETKLYYVLTHGFYLLVWISVRKCPFTIDLKMVLSFCANTVFLGGFFSLINLRKNNSISEAYLKSVLNYM